MNNINNVELEALKQILEEEEGASRTLSLLFECTGDLMSEESLECEEDVWRMDFNALLPSFSCINS